jgi:hypothetical protein
MASFKLNLARIDGCPSPPDLAKKMDAYGLPEAEPFGVLHCLATPQSVVATVVHRTQQSIQRLDTESGDVTTDAVEKAAVYPIGMFPKRHMLEIYEGAATGIDRVAEFLAGGLGLGTVVLPIELDILQAIHKLRSQADRFQLKSVRIKDYAHDSYMAGPYGPTFLDSEHGLEFLETYAESVTAAVVRFQGQAGRVSVNLSPRACFRYSLSHEDDNPSVQALLRSLV